LDTLVLAAKEVFVTSGVDAPVREIAERAGVGVATLYRHFPQRSDLVVAVFQRELEACADAAGELATQAPAVEALRLWLFRFAEFLGTKRGLSAALHSGDGAYASLPGLFDARLRPALEGLLSAAVSTGEIRASVSSDELITAVAGLCHAERPDRPGSTRRLISLLVDGLRYQQS